MNAAAPDAMASALHAAQACLRVEPRPDAWAALLEGLAELEAREVRRTEPLRTLHHFACTGGTLISKCIAALPNVQLLSEVDPLSGWLAPGAAGFSPTDMVTLLRHSSRGASPELIAGLFAEQMRFLHGDAVRQGLRLVVRDHAHSHFCHGTAVPERPTLRELMPAAVPLRSLVTVRHPLDSYASLVRQGWLHFEPRSVDNYCRRYLLFLDRHADVPVLRYEDFVAAPQPAMRRLCDALELQHEPGFVETFAGFRLSGDSGRSGQTIAPRPSAPEAQALVGEACRSAAFRQLVERLGYGAAPGTVVDP